MVERITQRKLERLVARINKRFVKMGQPEWELEPALHGKYAVVFKKSEHRVCDRKPARQTFEWLDGVDHALWCLREQVKA